MDKQAQEWGAWGGDRKLSPRYPTEAELRERRARGHKMLAKFFLCIWLLGELAVLVAGAGLISELFR